MMTTRGLHKPKEEAVAIAEAEVAEAASTEIEVIAATEAIEVIEVVAEVVEAEVDEVVTRIMKILLETWPRTSSSRPTTTVREATEEEDVVVEEVRTETTAITARTSPIKIHPNKTPNPRRRRREPTTSPSLKIQMTKRKKSKRRSPRQPTTVEQMASATRTGSPTWAVTAVIINPTTERFDALLTVQ